MSHILLFYITLVLNIIVGRQQTLLSLGCNLHTIWLRNLKRV